MCACSPCLRPRGPLAAKALAPEVAPAEGCREATAVSIKREVVVHWGEAASSSQCTSSVESWGRLACPGTSTLGARGGL